jgi:hypothetical protein
LASFRIEEIADFADGAPDECLRFPISEWGLGEKHLASLAMAAQARHLGGGSGFVQEYRSVRLKLHLRLANADPFLAHLRRRADLARLPAEFF